MGIESEGVARLLLPPIQIQTLLIFSVLLIATSSGEPHSRTKCSLECYALCMQSGTPSAAICNCPVDNSRNCTRFDKDLSAAEVSTRIPKTKSEYVDAHMIRVSIDPQPAAFAYVFEYSTISTEPDRWNFAGASAKPEAVFSILDPCRDYQFRVLIVVRTSNPSDVFDVIRPQPIPVQLPPFILNQQQISIEMPRVASANSSDDLKLYVKWSLPSGYIDGDIYSYESPALYPIQCSTPEGEIPTPRIEIVKGGGRLAVWLPPAVLEARCRMWVEVRMLPRCVRLEPFNIQKNIEIDCSRNPDLEVCSKESNPVCYESVKVSGSHGKAQISWQVPARPPLYYHVRYGPAESKGVAPFVTWQLAAKREVRVDGSLSSFSLDIPEDEDFGVQVCAILSKKRKRPKFGVIQVIPFQCSSCKGSQNAAESQCGDCGPIIGSTVLEADWKDRKLKNSISVKPLTTIAPKAQTSTVYRMETDLSVSGNGVRNEPHHKVKSDTRHSTDSPIELEKAEEINKKTHEDLGGLDIPKPAELPITTTTMPPMTTSESKSEFPTTTSTSSSTSMTPESSTPPAETFSNQDAAARKSLSEEIEKSVENLEKAIEESVNSQTSEVNATAVEQIDRELERRLEEAAKQLQDSLTNLVGNSSEVRHHEKAKKCLTSEGVVCEFGCEDRKTCICPSATHARLINGVCASRETMLHTLCLPRKEINATWDSESGNIMVRRSDALFHIEGAENVDKLFVEFGKVQLANGENDTSIEFNDAPRSKIVVLIQTVLKSSVFSTEPFIFHVNQSIDMNTTYGMRFCVFNSSQIRSPHSYNWDDVSRFEKNEQIAEVIQLSPVRFTNKLSSLYPTGDTYWSTVMTIAKISILVILAIAIFILVYLNCTKFRTLYDRKRTHYFRPFYIDPSIHLSSTAPSSRSSGGGLKREASRGYYDVRNSHLMM